MDNKNYFEWLGSLRGFAAILVILSHMLPYIEQIAGKNMIAIDLVTVGILDIGKIGVVLFFLLSGYLTPTSCGKRSLRSFLCNRFFRLYPVYWLSILLVGVVFRFDDAGLGQILANFSMLQIFFGQDDLVGLFWTMPIELMFYTLVIFALRWLWEEKYIKILLLFCCTATICVGAVRCFLWSSAPVAVFLLITAALLGHCMRLYEDGKVSVNFARWVIITFEITMLVTTIFAYSHSGAYQESWYRYFLSYSAAVFLFWLFWQCNFHARVLSRCGAVSYDLYLMQEIVHRYMFGVVWCDGICNIWLFAVITMVAVFAAAICVHYAVEKPAICLDEKIQRKFSEGTPQESP